MLGLDQNAHNNLFGERNEANKVCCTRTRGPGQRGYWHLAGES